MFHLEVSSKLDANKPGNRALREEHEKLMKEHLDYGGEKPADLPNEAKSEFAEYQEIHDNSIKQFYNCICDLSMVDSLPKHEDEMRDKQHCGIPRVRFLGTL
jgi:hypothetical protein